MISGTNTTYMWGKSLCSGGAGERRRYSYASRLDDTNDELSVFLQRGVYDFPPRDVGVQAADRCTAAEAAHVSRRFQEIPYSKCSRILLDLTQALERCTKPDHSTTESHPTLHSLSKMQGLLLASAQGDEHKQLYVYLLETVLIVYEYVS